VCVGVREGGWLGGCMCATGGGWTIAGRASGSPMCPTVSIHPAQVPFPIPRPPLENSFLAHFSPPKYPLAPPARLAFSSPRALFPAPLLQSKTTFKSTTPYHNEDNSFSLVELSKNIVKLDKPIYAGFTMLDLSKLHMYDSHYNIMKLKYGDNIQ
jgi:hypothetical protein